MSLTLYAEGTRMNARKLILAATLALAAAPMAAAQPASAACPAPTTGYAGAVASTTGLVGYWRLGETSGTTACDTAGTSNGTYTGGFSLGKPGALSGDPDTAAAFDGLSGYVSAPEAAALDVGDTFTAEAWVKRTAPSTGQWETVVSKQAGAWLLMFDENNDLVLRRSKYGNVAASTTPVADTNWHYIAATKGGSTVHLYVDGKDVTGAVTNSTMVNNTSPLVIGQSSASSWFDGAVDEVAEPLDGRKPLRRRPQRRCHLQPAAAEHDPHASTSAASRSGTGPRRSGHRSRGRHRVLSQRPELQGRRG
jgi:hypothetical protein